MGFVLVVHIVAGSLGLVTGFIALYAAKGAPLHRRIGMVFFAVMLVMTLTGVIVSAVLKSAPTLNIPAGILTAYLVVTGLTTVRPPATGAARLNRAAMLTALAVGLYCMSNAVRAIANGGTYAGMPAFPYFLFGFIGTLGSVGDVRWMRAESVRGSSRISRHLWRMSLALFVAAMSFFIGQSDEFPKPWRIMPLLAAPPLTVLVTMLYWLWRVSFRRSLRGLIARPDWSTR